ncbi:MAG: type II toxin-antitoxin system VapC family toxin [Gammaproteobacteria bacterium]|nr:type II toxin-antitoxin system VapC family toxin [Gammaproteobacteria bacterium]
MIGLDTNVLARYYIEDSGDSEESKQRLCARALIESGRPLMVCKTVLLELEWVMRGYYGFKPNDIASVFQHLLSMKHITMEERETVVSAISGLADGLDFADALHHASYKSCERIATFDDKKFARRLNRLGMSPRAFIPGSEFS